VELHRDRNPEPKDKSAQQSRSLPTKSLSARSLPARSLLAAAFATTATQLARKLYLAVPTKSPNSLLRLRKHADYQRVYTSSRKQFAKQMTFFFSVRPEARRSDTPGPRIGLTVGKVLGHAVERNRIKRRLRELVRRHTPLLGTHPVDVILHPRRSVLALEPEKLEREVVQIFQTIRKAIERSASPSAPVQTASAIDAPAPVPGRS
jgi:ribonuclease P protein component